MSLPFNLEKYIKEAFTSNILQNQILNEPSGFFRYVKNTSPREIHDNLNIPNRKARDVYNECKELLLHITKTIITLILGKKSYYRDSYIIDIINNFDILDPNSTNTSKKTSDTFELPNTYKNLSDNELININKKYNKDILTYQRKLKNLFKKPSGHILMPVLKGYSNSSEMDIDLLSITDSQFKKYTFTEVKEHKTEVDKIVNNEHCTVFYFNANGYFLGASHSGFLTCINTLVENSGKDSVISYTPKMERLLSYIKDFEISNGVEDVLKTKCNNSNKILYWPILKDSVSYEYIIDIIQNNFNIQHIQRHNKWSKEKKAGNIISSVSNVRKELNWGYNKNDYIIAFIPDMALNNEYQPNTFSHSAEQKLITKRRNNAGTSAFIYQPRKKYNELYKINPYRIGYNEQYVTIYNPETDTYKQIAVSEYGNHSVESIMHNIVWSPDYDKYVELCRNNYRNRLNKFKSLKDSNKLIENYKNNFYQKLLEVANYMKKIQAIEKQIRSLMLKREISTDDISLLKNELYGTDQGVVEKLNGTLPSMNQSLYGLNTLIRNAISIIGSNEASYIKIMDNYNIIENNFKNNNITHNDIDKASSYDYQLAQFQRQLKEADGNIQNINTKLYTSDMDVYINEINKILEKYS